GVIDLHGPADDVRIAAEIAPPQAVADHEHGMTAGRNLVRRQKRAPALGAHPEDLKVIPGDQLARDRTGAAAAAEADGDEAGAQQSRERAIVIAEVPVLGVRQLDVTSRARFGKDDAESGRAVDSGERS